MKESNSAQKPLKPTALVWRELATVAVIGTVTGAAAWLLKKLIALIAGWVTSPFDTAGLNWWFIVLPVVGILLVGFVVRRFVRLPLEHATDLIDKEIRTGQSRLPVRLTYASVVTSALTLGFGGSAGAESPIAYTGAAIGSNFARWFRLPEHTWMTMLACGAGAGIAAIFRAPVGGMFFAIEVLRMKFDVKELLLLATICLISGMTATQLGGGGPDVAIEGLAGFKWSAVLPIVIFAILAGVYSLFYLYTGDLVARRLNRMTRRPVAANVISGLMIGIGLSLFPALYGEGFAVVEKVARGDLMAAANGGIMTLFSSRGSGLVIVGSLAGILLLKGMLTAATNCGGGVAGEFAPTFFAGALLGALAWNLFPEADVPPGLMVACGMSAAMAGIVKAPLMAVFLTIEVTGAPSVMVPVGIAALVSYTTCCTLQRRFYRAW
ncbi:MAG: chloride channel protein [Clostridium sp.]|nr:chloride channel protein [Clostridium sp.]